MDYYKLFKTSADDSILEVVQYNSTALVLLCKMDLLGGSSHTICASHPIHLDMPPKVLLGAVRFGGQELLPAGYESMRNRGYGGDENNWRVMKIVDDEANEFYAIYNGIESFHKEVVEK